MKQIIEIACVMVIFLLLAAYMERQNSELTSANTVEKNAVGGSDKEIDLILNGDGLEKNCEYTLELPAEELTDQEVSEAIEAAKKEIDESVFGSYRADSVREKLEIKSSYNNNLVDADWFFDDYNYIDTEGIFNEDNLSQEGKLISAEVTLSCQDQEEIYAFSFMAYPKKLSQSEQLIKDIESEISKRIESNGRLVELPDEVDGVSLKWSAKREYLVVKVLLFELLVCLLLRFTMMEKAHKDRKKREESMKMDYSDIVSKMAILVGSGMTTKESWNRISTQYSAKRENNTVNFHPAYDEMLVASNEMKDGVSERIAYQNFGNRIQLSEYKRFIRTLISNLQKGNKGLCEFLEKEAANAFEERKIIAKKLGEEAGTKMLAPLILMMGIVIAIVIAPAMMNFRI